jgi:hypothetical protein
MIPKSRKGIATKTINFRASMRKDFTRGDSSQVAGTSISESAAPKMR